MRQTAVTVLALCSFGITAFGQVLTETGKAKIVPAASGVKNSESPAAVQARALKKAYEFCRDTGNCSVYLKEKERVRAAKSGKPSLGKPEPVDPLSQPVPVTARAVAGVPVPIPAPSSTPAGDSPGAESLSTSLPGAIAPTAEQDAALSRDAEQRRERVVTRTAGEVDAMRRSFFPVDEDAGAGGENPSAGRDEANASQPEREENRELTMAALTGSAATFRDQGLKVGADASGARVIQRLDGSAASKEELSALRAALKDEPLALQRRPDFFQVLPRETFNDLKQDYARRPELRPTFFKDIAMTPSGRDFRWSASCGGVSGGCNPYAGGRPYRRGRDVPPEDLKEVWQAVQAASLDEDDEDEEYEDDEDGFGDYTEEDRRLAEAEDLAAKMNAEGLVRVRGLGALFARMGAMARSLSGGFSDGGASASPVSGREAGAGRAIPSPVQSERRGVAGDAVATGPSARTPTPHEAPPVPDGPRAAQTRNIYPAAALFALVLLAIWLRRKT